MTQKIVPHLWFDKEAKEAAEFYVEVFSPFGGSPVGRPDSKINNVTTLHNTPSGDADTVSFQLWGQDFMAISAGPFFKFNPSVSLMVNFDPSRMENAKEKLDEIWQKLSEGGKVLMELNKYPFSERYGWVQDKYGLSWQLILTDANGEPRPAIVPSLLFTKDVYAKAEEASDFYISIFKDSKRGTLAKYPAGMEPDKEGAAMFTDFQLEGEWFAAMDSAPEHGHDFAFNEAVSFIVKCEDQEEIDYYWEKLSAVPESEQCGWLKDKYGVSWQVVPKEMDEMMVRGTPEQIDRVTQAFLPMKKFDLKKLREAFEG
jgi:predicted 3-demethylubiquinone-9 3-methyltransferase (glyoxalase superfamily)